MGLIKCSARNGDIGCDLDTIDIMFTYFTIESTALETAKLEAVRL